MFTLLNVSFGKTKKTKGGELPAVERSMQVAAIKRKSTRARSWMDKRKMTGEFLIKSSWIPEILGTLLHAV